MEELLIFLQSQCRLPSKVKPYTAPPKQGSKVSPEFFAREMADHGVTVNTLAPGPIKTALIAQIDERKIQKIVDSQIIKRQATPDDVWDIIQLILQKESRMITGAVFNIGGV